MGMIFGVNVLKLPRRIAFLATILTLPAPLFKVSLGTAGFVYPADLLAVGLAIVWIFEVMRNSVDKFMPTEVKRLAILLLIILPVATSILTSLDSETYRNIKTIILSHARGLGYLIVFLTFAAYLRKVVRPDKILILQIVLFLMISLCGLIQYSTGINLDLWNEVNIISNESSETGDFGGGFMGLYRGAVGGWGVGLLAVASAVLPGKKYGPQLLAMVVLCCMGIMISAGSRQGVIIGAAVLISGVWIVSRGMPLRRRGKLLLRCLSGLFLVIILGAAGYWGVAGSRFEQYAARRFGFLQSYTTIKNEIVARDESKRAFVFENLAWYPSILLTGVGYGTNIEVSGGRAMLYLDSEIFMIVQSNGVLYLLFYAIFLLLLRLRMGKLHRPKDVHGSAFVLGGVIALYAGILLTWGHFFLLIIGSNQAPIAYWNWALLGGAMGLCTPNAKRLQFGRQVQMG